MHRIYFANVCFAWEEGAGMGNYLNPGMENFQKMVNSEILDFLRNLIKDKAYIHLAYMTGILPIKNTGRIQH